MHEEPVTVGTLFHRCPLLCDRRERCKHYTLRAPHISLRVLFISVFHTSWVKDKHLVKFTTNALSCTTFLLRFGGTLQFCRGGAIFSTTWLPSFFLRSFQYGIAVTGVIDAFVHAHSQLRRNIENPGDYWDCMKG